MNRTITKRPRKEEESSKTVEVQPSSFALKSSLFSVPDKKEETTEKEAPAFSFSAPSFSFAKKDDEPPKKLPKVETDKPFIVIPRFTFGSKRTEEEPEAKTAAVKDVRTHFEQLKDKDTAVFGAAFAAKKEEISVPTEKSVDAQSKADYQEGVKDLENENESFAFKRSAIKGEIIETKTGEEDEELLFVSKAKLFTLDKESRSWKECGVGKIKLNCSKLNQKARLIMRTEETLRLILNTPLFQEFSLQKADAKGLQFTAYEDKLFVHYFLKFPSADLCQEFADLVSKNKS
eukprot:GCRY01004428.1.p1 GENE.GCRY01004428.1~~GCRY01004428.1.p1  ORF type:complete len:318 (-),score=45.36 GCRY01004428.1:9-878(-)